MTNTIQIGKATLSVTSEVKNIKGKDQVVYTLRGPKGGEYVTMRCLWRDHIMHIRTVGHPGVPGRFGKLQLTDLNGPLRVAL